MDDQEEDTENHRPFLDDAFAERRNRRQTNWLYRFDSIRSSQQREVDEMLEDISHIQQFVLYHTMMLTVLVYQLMESRPVFYLPSQVSRCIVWGTLWILNEIKWISCYGELLLLDVCDAIFYRISDRPPPADRFTECRHRTIDSFTNADADDYTGFNVAQLHALKLHWRIPERLSYQQGNRVAFTGEEAMLHFLTYLRKGEPYTDMASHRFGGDPRRISASIRLMTDHLFNTFYHKISGDSMREWLPHIDQFRYAIWKNLVDGYSTEADGQGGVREIRVDVDFESFAIFSFLDDFAFRGCAPGRERHREFYYAHDVQRAFYRGHGLKAQVLLLPNGICGSIFVASIRQNDNGVQNMSGLNDYLASLFRGAQMFLNNNRLPATYADAIFARMTTIIPRIRNPTTVEHRRMNKRMASLRQSIEHVFGLQNALFRGVRNWRRIRYFRNGDYTLKLISVTFFVWNCYQIVHEPFGKYNLPPPSLEEYLPLDEDLVPAPDLFQGGGLGKMYVYN